MSDSFSVLVVEDDIDMARLIETLLREIGVTEVRRARNGRQAIADLRTNLNKTDMIISDWNMPKLTGLELLQAVRKRRARLPFLMLTGRSAKEEIISAKKAEVTAYIVKPFAPIEFSTKVRALIAKVKSDNDTAAYIC